MLASRCAKVWATAGSVRSSAGTYTAWTEVIAAPATDAIRSSKTAGLSASVGW